MSAEIEDAHFLRVNTPTRRVTLKDVAEAAGVHYSSVSLALRDRAKIPAATRARIQKVARRLGYVPDPMLTAISVYRAKIRPKPYHSTIAWINSHPQRRDANLRMVNELFASARARAVDLGYQLEEFWTGDPALATGARLARVLRTRGIRGVLWAPLPRSEARVDFEWDDFSSLTFGRSLVSPQLHVVVNHQYRTMRRILEEIRKLGYRRIGLWLSEDYDRRVDHNWTAGFWVDYHARPPAERVEPKIYVETQGSRQVFADWIAAERPDVVVTGDLRALDWLDKLKFRVPADIGFCLVSLIREETQISGTYENHSMAAQAGVNLLIDMLHRGEQGVPAVPQTILIDCIWLPGRTLANQRTRELSRTKLTAKS